MRTLQIAALMGAVAVVLGAFGAHALAERLSTKSLANWDTATEYQFYHALALLAVGVLQIVKKADTTRLRHAATAFFVGTLLFSGSIYLLALREIAPFLQTFTPILGPTTPIGGLMLIAGWALLFAACWQRSDADK